MKKNSYWLVRFRVVFGVIGCAIVLYCAGQYFAVTGHLTIKQDFTTDDDSLVSLFIPANQAGDITKNLRTGETVQVITEAPVYFTVQVPRVFDSVTAKIQYASDYRGTTSFGVLELLNPLAIKEKIIDAPQVADAIAAHWNVVTDDATGHTIYSKDGLNFSEVQERAKKGESIITVGADLHLPYRDATYVANDSSHTIPNTLRGSHIFYTYIKNETLRTTFEVVDENLSIGLDPVSVVLRNEQNQVLDTQKLVDDGNQTNNRSSAAGRKITIERSNLPEGVYQIVVQTTRDVLLQQFVTQQEKFIVKDHLTFGNETESFDIQLGSSTLDAVTGMASGLGTLDVNGRPLSLTAMNENVVLKEIRSDEIASVPVRGEKGNVSLSFSGYAAFEPSAYFDPDFAVQPVRADTQLSDVTAIVTKDFTPPVENYRGREAMVELPLSGVLGDRKKLEFALNAPELLSEKEQIAIDSVTLEFHRASLWAQLKNRFFE